ncbi:MAG: ChbG/HpnK family deacetylase [Bacteroidales bacterium]|nr:ChbG/HpnK family deacetylase [Bacteroidales bacterium]
MMSNNKFLIINCDDFGWDKFANEGILILAAKQKISSLSIMANLVESDDLKKIPDLNNISSGLHLNLTVGKPISPISEVSSLVDENEVFLSQKALIKNAFLGKIKTNELEKEILAQLNFLKENHIKVSHIDSHKHIHQYPFIGPMILNILKKNRIEKIRNCRLTNLSHYKMKIVKIFTLSTNSYLKHFTTPQCLIPDFSVLGKADLEIFKNSISKAFRKYNVVEFMTHPATQNRDDSYLNRVDEFNFWLNEDWKQFLDENNIEVINYNQFGKRL